MPAVSLDAQGHQLEEMRRDGRQVRRVETKIRGHRISLRAQVEVAAFDQARRHSRARWGVDGGHGRDVTAATLRSDDSPPRVRTRPGVPQGTAAFL